MAKLDLNVAARPFVNERPLLVGTVVLAVALLGSSSWNVYALLRALDSSRALSAQVAADAAQKEEALKQAGELSGRLSDKEKRRIRSVAGSTATLIKKRQLAWTRLFEQLEAILPRDVRVLKVLPDVLQNRMNVLMECIARDNDSKVAFYRKLQEPPFSDGYLIGEQLEDGRILFSVKCRYDPQGPDAVPLYGPNPWELAAKGASPSPSPPGAEPFGLLPATAVGAARLEGVLPQPPEPERAAGALPAEAARRGAVGGSSPPAAFPPLPQVGR